MDAEVNSKIPQLPVKQWSRAFRDCLQPGPTVLGSYTGRKVGPVQSGVLQQTVPEAEAAHPLGENSLSVPRPSYHLDRPFFPLPAK